jgi:hypothetical protein
MEATLSLSVLREMEWNLPTLYSPFCRVYHESFQQAVSISFIMFDRTQQV